MEFFNENSLGEVTGVCTHGAWEYEMLGPYWCGVYIMGGLIGRVFYSDDPDNLSGAMGLFACAAFSYISKLSSSMEEKVRGYRGRHAQKSQTATDLASGICAGYGACQSLI